MRRILHILTQPPEPFVAELLSTVRELPEHTVTVVNLSVPNPDYGLLLEKIFEADSIQTF
jgi:hypothetical protein